jgi:Arc/MetJ family transcription regulator
MHMARTVIDLDDEMLARAQRALGTTTKRDTVNAALAFAAAAKADERRRLLESFQELLGRLDWEVIMQDEAHNRPEGGW